MPMRWKQVSSRGTQLLLIKEGMIKSKGLNETNRAEKKLKKKYIKKKK